MELIQGKACNMDEAYVFISYSSQNKDLVWNDVQKFQHCGYNVWMDEYNLDKTKPSWKEDALEAIRDMNCELLVFYVSEASLTSEPCLNEMRATVDEDALMYHSGKAVSFIAVDAENIGNIVTFRDKISEKIKENKNIDKEEKKRRMRSLQGFLKEFFNSNNERVRIKPRSEIGEKAYYEEIMKYFPASAKINDSVKMEYTPESLQQEESIAAEIAVTEEVDITHCDVFEEQLETKENVSAEDIEKVKIGEYVKNAMLHLIKEDLIAEELLDDMQSAEWSKEVLNLNYPLLLELDPEKDVNEQRADKKGRARYWATPYLIHGVQYFICNDWYEKHTEYFEEFLRRIEAGEELKQSSKDKKRASLTGDVTYTIYGKKYTENQSDMMLRIFAQVLSRHQDKVDTLPEQDGMNCAEKYENIEQPGTSAAKPSYFRVCSNFEFDNGSAVCIGTAYSSGDKMKKIARLLEICGEDRSVFYSEQLELPKLGRSRASSNSVEYTFYGQKYTGDQTEMMCHVCSFMIEEHPEKLQELVENTLCIGYNDSSIEGKTYFRVSRLYQCDGREYKVGTSFSMVEKLKQIAKVFAICGEGSTALQIEGYEFVVKEVKDKKVKTGKVKKNFLE